MANAQSLPISEQEYARVRALLYREAGISLGPQKQALVCGRLFRRVEALGLDTYDAYVSHLARAAHDPSAQAELRTAVDLLTTNDTYFWREPGHFARLEALAREAAARQQSFSVWSAASSSGEEAYTIAMVLQSLADGGLPLSWDLMGSDISRRVLAQATQGCYPAERVQQLPERLLKRYCLRGHGPAQGTVLVDKSLRRKLRFMPMNLIEPLPRIGPFDVIFLRNVLIYFDVPTKQKVVRSVMSTLRPGGLLFVGMAESLNGVVPELRPIGPDVYGT
jgi:chemotaxis protein methyltransferase CheR